MQNKKLVIFGARNFAELAYYYFNYDSHYAIEAFVVDSEYVRESTFEGLPVIALDQLKAEFPPNEYDVFVALGIGQVNQQRAMKLAEIEAMGYQAASFVSSKASIGHRVDIRPNTMIMEHSIVHPAVHIGKNCILFPDSGIAFKSWLGDNCWVVSATLAEAVRLGANTFLGVRAVVGPNVTLGESCIVGAGAVVLSDAESHTVFRAAKADRRIAPERMRRNFGVNQPGS